ncbi:helix-turn-helix domain-containing protein [Paenirhodobacter sp. CAU 1674]|uniref:helix-turn-helix domain-containing protein n=1 Tax=Paenirhodobacter sp. CAU 1674 TaxID=3032596 RepID=UPI0023DB03C9|nr:helix-turn-helix domain-containing protein [Paenirhodobacter sp. CAU 1674]MDF2140831.1 helix-turn-helix domain-containing protein [Paenirhodobacter sp. CAU 1674]
MTGAQNDIPSCDLTRDDPAEILHEFLSFWRAPTRVELGLWVAATAQIDRDLPATLGEWLRSADWRPQPREIIALHDAMKNPHSMRSILVRAAMEYGVAVSDITGPSMTQHVSSIRQQVMSDMRAAGYTLGQIGRVLQRDTSTVQHGIKAHTSRVRTTSSNTRSSNDLH